ncbi:MAG TPA: Mth938-like domain-containing protein [Roseiarcus sp.]|nr:Mth938-like domain-containing protein [Roseiarcus sp.]
MSEPGGYVPGRRSIEAYGAGGFRFAGMSHRGSILATPAGVRAIAPLSFAELDAETLRPLFDEMAANPRSIEILVIGTGEKLIPLGGELRDRLRKAGLRFEAMATGPAARMYNVLIAEERRVAAVLIAAP